MADRFQLDEVALQKLYDNLSNFYDGYGFFQCAASYLPAAHDTIGDDVQFADDCLKNGGHNFPVNMDGTTNYVVFVATGFYPNVLIFAPMASW